MVFALLQQLPHLAQIGAHRRLQRGIALDQRARAEHFLDLFINPSDIGGRYSALSFFGIKVFPAVILGGLDSIIGAIVGGIIVGVLENLAQYVDSQWLHWGNMFEIAPFYVLIVILMIKPYGLFGTRDIERV